MQAKQKSLLERVDALDEECEELQRQLGQREEREINLQNQLQEMSEEKEQLRAQLVPQQVLQGSFIADSNYLVKCIQTLYVVVFPQNLCLQLQKEKQTTETHVGELKTSIAELQENVQTLRERERLLVAFPELSAQAQPQSKQIYVCLTYIIFFLGSSIDGDFIKLAQCCLPSSVPAVDGYYSL